MADVTLFGVPFAAADFRDGGHLDLVTINGQSLERFLAALYAVGLEANAMKGVGAISTTSLAIGTGTRAFTFTPTTQAWDVGQVVRAASLADPANYMVGDVTSTGTGTVTLDVTITGGSGTHADWYLSTPAPGLSLPMATSQGGTGKTYDVVPTGTILPWATETIPTGFLEANGAALSRTTYAALFAVLGTRYGVGDGSTTFNLPSLRGKFLRGWANGSANDPDRATRTDRGDGTTGDNVGTQQAAAYENHGHALRFSQNNTNGANTGDGKYGFTAGVSLFALQTTTGVTTYSMYGNDYAQGYTAALDDGSGSSGTSAWETRPYNVAVAFVIKY